MYAILRTGGRQFRVEPGAVLRVPLMKAAVGADIEFDEVLQVADGGASKIGQPVVAGAKVKATVLRHGKEPKILVYKFKRRKGYEKRRGHRQDFTEIKITGIEAGA
ncbi:MAG: 50S ribosomal protein L21 [Candidatus Sumerlaeaceae bacterium]|nr:50S ribosomal protein L21 [Candidatus Sumerlaeaceae bacterium]